MRAAKRTHRRARATSERREVRDLIVNLGYCKPR